MVTSNEYARPPPAVPELPCSWASFTAVFRVVQASIRRTTVVVFYPRGVLGTGRRRKKTLLLLLVARGDVLHLFSISGVMVCARLRRDALTGIYFSRQRSWGHRPHGRCPCRREARRRRWARVSAPSSAPPGLYYFKGAMCFLCEKTQVFVVVAVGPSEVAALLPWCGQSIVLSIDGEVRVF